MKKLLFLFILFFSFSAISHYPAIAKAENVYYAKIESNNIFLYSSPISFQEYQLFILPKTYFVKLINEANDEFYYCSYKDVKGYVMKNDVVVMNGTPNQPYVEGKFRTFSLDGLGLYSMPKLNNENCLATIPYLTDDLIFYGTISGQELVPDKSNEWIYCKYNSGSSVYGYVYSVFCDKVPTPTENTEYFEKVENPFYKSDKPKELSSVSMGFIIIGVAIPCLIVLFLLIKPTLNKEKLNTLKPKLKAKRHNDYFEFDDSDLN